MSRRRAVCLRAFPGAWRRRYGDELVALLAQDGATPWSADLDLLRAGLRERVHDARPGVLMRAGGLVAAVCALVALVPAVVAPATSTPHGRPIVLAAVTVPRSGGRWLTLARAAPVAVRGRPLVSTVVIRASRIQLHRAHAAVLQARLVTRART